MLTTYLFLSCKLVTSFSTFLSSILFDKNGEKSNYEVHVVFQGIEHQLQENILLHNLLSIQNCLLEGFVTLPNHINYLYSNIYDMMILDFYHNLSYICY